MATTIRFTGASDNLIEVAEGGETVAAALRAAAEGIATLTRADGKGRVFVQANAVACWFDGAGEGERADSGIASSMSPL